MTEPFRVICADPPWRFSDRLPGNGRGAEKHYRCLSLLEIARFPLPPLADDAVLFLWRVSSMPNAALAIVESWGFRPKTELVWCKTTSSGKQHFGMGRILRASHETCIVATRGRIQPKVRNVRTVFEAPVGRHSEKPARFFEIVESLFDGPYVELFARERRSGWTQAGDELPAEAAE